MTLHQQLVAIALHVFAALGVDKSPDARELADQTARAVEAEQVPASGESFAVDMATAAYYEAKESGASKHPVPVSWDARAGLSCGALQLRCYLVTGRSVQVQAATWLDSWHRAGLGRGVDSSPSRAEHRLTEARRLLVEALPDLGY